MQRVIGRRARGTNEVSVTRGSKTGARNDSRVRPKTLNLWRHLMDVARKLRAVLNALRQSVLRSSW